MNQRWTKIHREKASEASTLGLRSSHQGGLGACPQQAKKGRSPPAPQELFWERGTHLHTCITKLTPNNPKIHQTKIGKNI